MSNRAVVQWTRLANDDRFKAYGAGYGLVDLADLILDGLMRYRDLCLERRLKRKAGQKVGPRYEALLDALG